MSTGGQTPISNTTPYLSVDEFITFKDIRLGQLAVDDNTQPNQSQLETNARLNAILMAASGEIEASLLASERYSNVDLSQPNGNSSQFLKLLCADLALFHFFSVRGGPEPPAMVLTAYDRALDTLKRLTNGELILAFAETAEAGTAYDVDMNWGDYQKMSRFTDSCSRVLGIRNERRRTF